MLNFAKKKQPVSALIDIVGFGYTYERVLPRRSELSAVVQRASSRALNHPRVLGLLNAL